MKDVKEGAKRGLAGTLALYMFLTSLMIFVPVGSSYALTGGPSQPEVQSFEPIGTSDMVDLFSGDYTYNIPLLDVEGYPINLAYHSGVGMDEEASWVGLGWNVNVGTINRSLRGLPDDFNGDKVTTKLNIKPDITIGTDFSVGDIEILGKEIGGEGSGLTDSIDISINLGMNYNNYKGVGFDIGISGSFKLAGKAGFGTLGLGLNSSSSGGLNISPDLSLGRNIQKIKRKQNQLTGTLGFSFNSRAGLSFLTLSSSGEKKTKSGKSKSYRGTGSTYNLMQPTYTPRITQSMRSFATSGRLKIGPEAPATHVAFAFGANYSEQRLPNAEKSKSTASYGYLYSEYGQFDPNARMDFNRENEGSATPSTPNLAVTSYTYDIYSVSGQGVGGSYRPYRGQVGFVFSNKATNRSVTAPFSLEAGGGTWAKVGASGSLTVVDAETGVWKDGSGRFKGKNKAYSVLNFQKKGANPDFENVYFKNANEMSVNSDEGHYSIFGEDQPVRLVLEEKSKYNVEVMPKFIQGTNITGPVINISRNTLNARVKRNTTIENLTVKEVRDHYGVNEFDPGSYAKIYGKNHHLGQIVSLGTDGMRYVYGQPAYNTYQKEVSFAVGQTVDGIDFEGVVDYEAGLVTYDPAADNTLNNDWGLNHYYSSVETPAYAHSFLLTSILSNDYVDVDNIKGPSDGDLGTYTKFSYARIGDYKWRVPVESSTATFNEGLKGDFTDDMGTYLYGEKEVWYLDKIETKNFIAVFETIDREDAFGVLNENGGMDVSKPLQALNKISLYSKEDIRVFGNNATPLKEVHFVYDYDLCPGIPNSANSEGKLTLKKVYFTYRDSQKGKLSPYSFNYQNNYSYDLKAYDRWGNYMPNNATSGNYNDPNLATFEYPYTNQSKTLTDQYASAWTLSEIGLPSGGTINMHYESDDYAYVQNKKAMEMVKIVDVGDNGGIPHNYGSNAVLAVADNSLKNHKIFFEKDPLIPASKYTEGIEDLYFRCLMEFDDPDVNNLAGRYDYVSGYCQIQSVQDYALDSSLGCLTLNPVSFRDADNGNVDKNPIALAGIQFGMIHLPQYVWDSPAFNENQTFDGALINALFQTLANFVEGFKNPNKAIFDKNRGTRIVTDKSWLRLNNVSGVKLGGGCRVKSIIMSDNWAEMTQEEMNSFDYGQEYSYMLTDGTSSGVASYEPQLGGDENPWKQPVFHSNKKLFAPDERFYQETPFGESFFPSASVGYSKVEVKNLTRFDDLNANGIQEIGELTTVKRNATGKVVHEFYTAKDFPTRVSKTMVDKIPNKSKPYGLASLLKIESSDYMTASQGFVVENNDMHGKPKSQSVYQENQSDPITSVEYVYLGGSGSSIKTGKVENEVSVIYKDGSTDNRIIGVNYDVVADFQESTTSVVENGVNINLDVVPLGFIPAPIPTFWPKFSSDKTAYRTATITKVIQKFGVLEKTVATDLGSVVETKNLAYDAETGEVLLTETTTNYNDRVYSLNFPAYWYYDNFGPSYQNIGFDLATVSGSFNISNGKVITTKSSYFVEGDEIALRIGGTPMVGWITEVTGNSISIVNKFGAPISGVTSQFKVIRSGRRNLQSQMMASITSLTNPLGKLRSGNFTQVLQASAIEFSEIWRTYCDCEGTVSIPSTNPYVMGTKGSSRPISSFLHLSGRTQSDVNDNTNVRKDGVFESFTPFYKLNASNEWYIDRKDWTFTAEVTEFNPYGQELANEDALGRPSAAQFGFNQTLAKAVAANADYRDIGFSSFEDDDFSVCADNHFKFEQTGQRVSSNSHSGRYSIQVTSSNNATLYRELEDRCPPVNECTLETNFLNPINSTFITIVAAGGSGDYNFSYEVLSGNPFVVMTGLGVESLKAGDYKIEYIVTDTEGCSVISFLEVENGLIVNE